MSAAKILSSIVFLILICVVGFTVTIFPFCEGTEREVVYTQAIDKLQSNKEIKALRKGTQFLVNKQNKPGFWTDFDCTAQSEFWHIGISDQWVTGTVAACLREAEKVIPSRKVRKACEYAEEWLKQSIREQGWGWNVVVDPDADSTAWVLRSNLSKYHKNLSLLDLAGYQRDNGGIATYMAKNKGTWSWAHPDVTANIILSLQRDQHRTYGIDLNTAINYLVEQQMVTGEWEAFWWDSSVYTTALAGEVLLRECRFRKSVEKAEVFIKQAQNVDGGWGTGHSNTVDTALCVKFLSLLPKKNSNIGIENCWRRGIAWLCTRQSSDGSWPPSKLLLVPEPLSGAKTEELKCEDSSAVFSSALAVNALSHAIIVE